MNKTDKIMKHLLAISLLFFIIIPSRAQGIGIHHLPERAIVKAEIKHNNNKIMEREIKFRGNSLEQLDGTATHPSGRGKLVFGSLWVDPRDGRYSIWSPETNYWTRVDPATVGQFTGLKDRNGEKIWEGDVLGCHAPFVHIVVWIDGAWHQVSHPNYDGGRLKQSYITELDKVVIGNIHSNPELLKNE